MDNELDSKGLKSLFGADCHICSITEENGKIIIHIKSDKTEDRCPDCGAVSSSQHCTYTRDIQDTPMRNKETWLRVRVHKFDCLNPQCETKVFCETLSFAGRSQVRTHELTLMALAVAQNMGNETASQALTILGVKMSNDTITRIYAGLDFEDDPLVEEIGIDDVSNRKGQTYFTVIYELNTHRLLTLLEGRDGEALKEWLRGHKKVRLVARDRSSSYATVVSEILPDAVQVADRFHLIDNMLDRIKDIVKAALPDKIFIAGGEILEKPPEKEAGLAVDPSLLSQMQYDDSPPVDSNGVEIQFESISSNINSAQYKAQAQARKAKQQLIRDMQKYRHENPGEDMKKLAARFGVSASAAKKYLSMADADIAAMDSRKKYKKRKPRIMDGYSNMIFKMLRDNIESEVIFAYVRKCGFSGNPMSLSGYIENVKENNFPDRKAKHPLGMLQEHYPEGVEAVSRSSLLKYDLTCNPKTPLNAKVGEAIGAVTQKFPVLDFVGKAFRSFHSIIMGDSPDALDGFLKEYGDSVFKPFCDTIKKDIAPVKCAISLPVSSGFVEGCNNKFKLLKRSLYGRSNFVNL